mmetsp:Transcript_25348/g.50790  ORF Transcript_25348/g.50790 Transcript_25348/m.50790 type:complete len:506 (+) Transcript_25348:139-1656(+)
MTEHHSRYRSQPTLLFLLLIALSSFTQIVNADCSASDNDFTNDPAIQTMTFDMGYGPQEFRAYVEPDVSTFYNAPPGSKTRSKPKHPGWAAKFINMSNKRVRLFWDPQNGGPGSPITILQPFEAGGTASFPRHEFYVTPYEDEQEILHRWSISPPQAVYYYDPITVPGDEEATQTNLDNLSVQEFESYRRHVDNRDFAKHYFNFTGREYLSMYPRNKPSHKIWRADYFGQEHWVTTRETHFVEHPQLEELSPIKKTEGRKRVLRDDEPRLLQQYRTQEPYLNMTLKVLSCAPRAFEINNFLSQTEVDHIMYLTTGMELHRSTTAGEETGTERDQTRNTRTSLNTWVYREKDQIIDTIYRRAADLLRIDEALMRPRSNDEYPKMGSKGSIAEALQLVHYDVGQEYTAHHDFGYSNMFSSPKQPQRFATVLLYLNEPEEGGETEFPRWVNAETREGLAVEPQIGKAVLFYSQLGDGNMDDWSHHAALPVKKGEKWLMNLWVWDPVYQ